MIRPNRSAFAFRETPLRDASSHRPYQVLHEDTEQPLGATHMIELGRQAIECEAVIEFTVDLFAIPAPAHAEP